MTIAGSAAHAVPAVSSSGIGSTSRLVTLITGERVLVRTTRDGRQTMEVIRSAQDGPAAQLTRMSLNGHHYVVPAVAQPYLGRYLDPSLFDVTTLAAGGHTARTEVRITFKRGTTPSLPGVTITSANDGVASGYVTPSSARIFGAALAAQAVVDSRSGWPASSPLFGSVTGIDPDSPSPAAVEPSFPQVTLIIKERSSTGRPTPFGFGILMNADDGRKYASYVFIVNGEARVSVPRGHYVGIFDDVSFKRGGTLQLRVMSVSDYTVTTDQQILKVDARKAVVSPSVTTPKPSSGQELDVTMTGTDARGYFSFSSGYGLSLPGGRILLAPSDPPAVGSFRQTTRWIRVDPNSPGGAYSYDATFDDDGVPVDQSRAVPGPAHTGTVDESYASDRFLRVGATARAVFVPGQFFASATFIDLPMPLSRTEYIYVPTGSILYDTVVTDFYAWDPGFVDEDAQTAEAGSRRSDSWLRSPFTMGVPAATPADSFPLCYACRSAKGMTFAMFPTDGDPTHIGEVYGSPSGSPVLHFSVYRNGVRLLAEADSFGDIFEVPKGPGTYRVLMDLNRAFTYSSLSTSLKTDVTFESSGTSGSPMPPSWYCFTARNCRVLGVLQALVDLHATPQGTLPVGTSTFDVSVGHIQGAADSAINEVTVAVRRPHRTGWIPLTVTRVAVGRYLATFTAGANLDGQAMDLRVTATDDDGGILRQTTARAFVVSS